MKIATWNCRVGAFARKAERLAHRQLDILAVQEAEAFEPGRPFTGVSQPTFVNRLTHPRSTTRSIAMLSYTSAVVTVDDADDCDYSFRRFRVRVGKEELQVAAVWPFATGRVSTSYRQAHQALERFSGWIRQRPTIVLGDFNASEVFRGPNWKNLLQILTSFDLTSAYHAAHPDEPYGQEKQPTYFHLGKRDKPFHLDYCFVPTNWVSRMSKVEVGAYDDWRSVSDHMPVMVDLDGI